MFKAFMTNSSGILFSRILGFIRDLLTASTIGANIYSDIFFVAFKLPNLFRRIFAEGAFSQAFLPAFIKTKEKGRFASLILIRFLSFILFLTLLVMLLAPFVTKLIAFGFDEKTLTLATPLVRINFWYLPLIYIVTFLSALLHFKGHFATTAYSTALLNIAMIVALLFSNPNEPQNGVYYLSIGVIVGGILQLMTHLIAIKRKRVWRVLKVGLFKFKEKKRNYKEFYKNFWHSVLGNSTAQLASFIDTWLASFLVSGSISYLYYSNRIFQLPLALFAIALSISLFPKIAKQVNKKEVESANKTLKDGFWVLAFLLLPSTVGGYMLAPEIVKILFERGAFLKEDSLQTAKVLQMYLIGLAPFGLSRLFSLWLYSMGLQAKAAKISAISLILNIILSILLISPYGASGLALASSISGFLLFILTIKAYGTKKFLAILHLKQIAILAIVLILEIFLLTIFKEILNAYL